MNIESRMKRKIDEGELVITKTMNNMVMYMMINLTMIMMNMMMLNVMMMMMMMMMMMTDRSNMMMMMGTHLSTSSNSADISGMGPTH